MNPIQHVIRLARARLMLASLLEWSGRLLLIAAVLACGLVAAQRLGGWQWGAWVYLALAGAAIVGALGVAIVRRPGDAAVAVMVDQRLHLKDRLGTALYAQSLTADPVARQVVADAQRVAGGLAVARAFPLRPGRSWAGLPVAALAVVLMHVFLPADLLGLAAARQQRLAQNEQIQAQEEQAREDLVKVVEALRKAEPPAMDEQDQGDLPEAVKELAEMTRGDLASPQMRKQAVARLADVQEKLARDTQAKEQELQMLQNALSRLDPGRSGPTDRFADALRRGDFAAAMKELENLAAESQGMSEGDRAALTRQLESLAEQLVQAAQQAQAQQAAAQQAMQQAMQNAGLSQQQAQNMQQQLQQGATQQQVQQQLQQQGMSPQQAQQLAGQLQQMQQNQQGQGQCSSCNSGLSQSLSQMAQSMQQGQQGQMQQGAGQAGQQLSQMAQMQQQLQQMRMSQYHAQQAMQSLAQGGTGAGSMTLPNAMKPSQTNPLGGNGAGAGIGSEPGGYPLDEHRQMEGYQIDAVGDIGQGQGRIIASWLSPGENFGGQPTVEFDQAVTEARSDAERAVTEDRVPRRYHQAIKSYFNQLPQDPQEVPKSAPQAPR